MTPKITSIKRSALEPPPKSRAKKPKGDNDIATTMEKNMAVVTEMNARNSPLLHLSGELPNRVYDYVIGGNEVTPTTSSSNSEKFVLIVAIYQEGSSTGKRWCELFNLSHASRQLREDTRLLPYKLNVFQVISDYMFADFVSKVGCEKREAIETLSFGSKGGHAEYDDDGDHISSGDIAACSGVRTFIIRDSVTKRQKESIERFASEQDAKIVYDHGLDEWLEEPQFAWYDRFKVNCIWGERYT